MVTGAVYEFLWIISAYDSSIGRVTLVMAKFCRNAVLSSGKKERKNVLQRSNCQTSTDAKYLSPYFSRHWRRLYIYTIV